MPSLRRAIRIARLNSERQFWIQSSIRAPQSTVRAIVVQPDGQILSVVTLPRWVLSLSGGADYTLNSDGTVDVGWIGTNANNIVVSLLAGGWQGGARGRLHLLNGNLIGRYGRYSTNGTFDSTLNFPKPFGPPTQ